MSEDLRHLWISSAQLWIRRLSSRDAFNTETDLYDSAHKNRTIEFIICLLIASV